MYENLLYQTAKSITIITINRPSVRNALNSVTMRELKSAFEEARTDAASRVIILTGSGDKAFVAGADINELAKLSPVEGRDYSLTGQAIFEFIENLGKPVIAAVNGYALGGGCELAMACTFRIASDNAMFGQPEVKLGIIPGYGGTQRLSKLVGRGQASQLLITGEMISAVEALRIGLVNQVVPQADLIPTVEGIAKKVISNAPVAVKFSLDALDRGMQMEATLFGLSCTTEDMKEGTKAFLEKRAAEFKGK
jgi:enoyl-CoA hydratase/carnithine racemase